jgi:hypothetical protein
MVLAILLHIRTKTYKLAVRGLTMSVPGAEGDDTICPVCDSERTEERKAASGMGELSHRCLDCDAEFDDTGARIDL